jgi:ketosteroid isomerase-like protein
MNPCSKFLFLVTLLIAVAVTSLSAQTSPNSAKEIATIRQQWETNWNAKNLEALVKLYSQDAVLLTSAGQRIAGRDAISNYLKKALDSLIGPLSIKSISEEDSGNLAFDSGSFTDKTANTDLSGKPGTSGGVQQQTEGYYLIVLKRQGDGRWLIQQQSSTDVPPAAK